MSSKFCIVFLAFDGMTQLDLTGPHELFFRLPNSEVIVASINGGTVVSEGLAFADTRKLAAISRCDLLCVPGGLNAIEVALDQNVIEAVQRLARGARYVTSVCTGSLILGAAGLLVGKRAACHWAWRHLLPLFGAVGDDARVVRDGNIITGGGVTAGIDFALTVAAEIAGEAVAKTIQLGLEYSPCPPFNAGRPETATPDILRRYRTATHHEMIKREAQAQLAADRLLSSTCKI